MAYRPLAELSLANTDKADPIIWSELPPELVEKCLGHLPVLTIALKLREVNKEWRDYAGTSPFMNLHNHGKNLYSSFGFLMFGTNILTHRCETMALDHEALKWQMGPSLQLHGPHRTCKVESVSEGILLLNPHPATALSFIVWNPLLRCTQVVPGISQEYTNVNLMVDRATASFKIVAFTASFRECLTYSPTTSSWHSANYEAPYVFDGLFFQQQREGGHIAVTHKNCVYVAVASLRNDIHEVGDWCYDVEMNVWKPAVMCRVSPANMELYGYCYTRSMFVVNDVMYKVVEYQAGVPRMGNDRPCPTVQILARSLAPANNAGEWAVIASTVLPICEGETKWVGSWYACTLDDHTKPTICGIFKSRSQYYMMMCDVGTSTWKKVAVSVAPESLQEDIGIMINVRNTWRCQWTSKERKWMSMRMVLQYTPSWICPDAECTHNRRHRHGRAHLEAV